MTAITRNFARVSDRLYRCGKYSALGLHRISREFGIESVVDLREAWRVPLLSLRTYDRIGLKYLRSPISELGSFDESCLSTVLDTVGTSVSLVHCYKGCHRTGAFVAWYRVRLEGWTADRAIREMLSYGCWRHHADLETRIRTLLGANRSRPETSARSRDAVTV